MFELWVALAALFIAAFGAFVEIYSIRAIDKRLQREHDFIEERGDFGEQIERWLTTVEEMPNADDPEKPILKSKLQSLTEIISASIFKSMKYSNMQSASVERKFQNKLDRMVVKGIRANEPQGMKILRAICEKLEIDLDWFIEAGKVPQLVKSLDKHGAGALMAANPSGRQKTWDGHKWR